MKKKYIYTKKYFYINLIIKQFFILLFIILFSYSNNKNIIKAAICIVDKKTYKDLPKFVEPYKKHDVKRFFFYTEDEQIAKDKKKLKNEINNIFIKVIDYKEFKPKNKKRSYCIIGTVHLYSRYHTRHIVYKLKTYYFIFNNITKNKINYLNKNKIRIKKI